MVSYWSEHYLLWIHIHGGSPILCLAFFANSQWPMWMLSNILSSQTLCDWLFDVRIRRAGSMCVCVCVSGKGESELNLFSDLVRDDGILTVPAVRYSIVHQQRPSVLWSICFFLFLRCDRCRKMSTTPTTSTFANAIPTNYVKSIWIILTVVKMTTSLLQYV